jgi:hypothetical protein
MCVCEYIYIYTHKHIHIHTHTIHKHKQEARLLEEARMLLAEERKRTYTHTNIHTTHKHQQEARLLEEARMLLAEERKRALHECAKEEREVERKTQEARKWAEDMREQMVRDAEERARELRRLIEEERLREDMDKRERDARRREDSLRRDSVMESDAAWGKRDSGGHGSRTQTQTSKHGFDDPEDDDGVSGFRDGYNARDVPVSRDSELDKYDKEQALLPRALQRLDAHRYMDAGEADLYQDDDGVHERKQQQQHRTRDSTSSDVVKGGTPKKGGVVSVRPAENKAHAAVDVDDDVDVPAGNADANHAYESSSRVVESRRGDKERGESNSGSPDAASVTRVVPAGKVSTVPGVPPNGGNSVSPNGGILMAGAPRDDKRASSSGVVLSEAARAKSNIRAKEILREQNALRGSKDAAASAQQDTKKSNAQDQVSDAKAKPDAAVLKGVKQAPDAAAAAAAPSAPAAAQPAENPRDSDSALHDTEPRAKVRDVAVVEGGAVKRAPAGVGVGVGASDNAGGSGDAALEDVRKRDAALEEVRRKARMAMEAEALEMLHIQQQRQQQLNDDGSLVATNSTIKNNTSGTSSKKNSRLRDGGKNGAEQDSKESTTTTHSSSSAKDAGKKAGKKAGEGSDHGGADARDDGTAKVKRDEGHDVSKTQNHDTVVPVSVSASKSTTHKDVHVSPKDVNVSDVLDARGDSDSDSGMYSGQTAQHNSTNPQDIHDLHTQRASSSGIVQPDSDSGPSDSHQENTTFDTNTHTHAHTGSHEHDHDNVMNNSMDAGEPAWAHTFEQDDDDFDVHTGAAGGSNVYVSPDGRCAPVSDMEYVGDRDGDVLDQSDMYVDEHPSRIEPADDDSILGAAGIDRIDEVSHENSRLEHAHRGGGGDDDDVDLAAVREEFGANDSSVDEDGAREILVQAERERERERDRVREKERHEELERERVREKEREEERVRQRERESKRRQEEELLAVKAKEREPVVDKQVSTGRMYMYIYT